MKKDLSLITIFFAFFLAFTALDASACTSMLVSAKSSGTGRPLMWKHRDTSKEDNFIERVPATDGRLGYVALFNGGDSKLQEAWIGMNDAGFAVMNTASYNLAPDTVTVKDHEGFLMTVALRSCRTVDDFENLLKAIQYPIGIEANFGVMDADGHLAYFEASDYAYKRFDVDDTDEGYLIRTNYSVSGREDEGYGFIREMNLRHVLREPMAAGKLRPEHFTEEASRSFYHVLLGKDFATDSCEWIVDQDFIPRRTSTASIVIEGVNPGEPAKDMMMYTALGYPPCSIMQPVTLTSVPENLRPTEKGYLSSFCNNVLDLKRQVFPLTKGNGKYYINMNALRQINLVCKKKSLQNYLDVYKKRLQQQSPQQ